MLQSDKKIALSRFRPTKRSDFLVAFGVLEIALGLSYLDTDRFTPGRVAVFEWVPWLDPALFGLVMPFVGVFALVCGVLRRFETGGLTLASVPLVGLAGLYLGANLVGQHPLGWAWGITFSMLCLILWFAAGVVDVPDRVVSDSGQGVSGE